MVESLTAQPGERLTFTAAGRRLALPARDVAEILRVPILTRVPNGPENLLGVANLRGAVMPVVSLAGLLGRHDAPASAASRVVVVNTGTPVGFLVDRVGSLTRSDDAEGLDLPTLLERTFASLLRRKEKHEEATGRQQSVAAAAQATQADELALIGFVLAGQEYALPLEKVMEVVRLPAAIAALPRTDRAMLGVTAIRDLLVPLVSARVLLGLPLDDFDPAEARIVVTRFGSSLVGLVVDTMSAILRVPVDAVDAVPPVMKRGNREAQVEAICRLEGGRRLVSVLSPSRIFDAETTAYMLAKGSDATAAAVPADARDGHAERFIVFQLGTENYGVPIAAIDEVVRHPDMLTKIPRAPAFIDGMMNLRGRAIPVIDQRRRFGVAGKRKTSGRVVVIKLDGLQAGLSVDNVTDILAVPSAELKSVPDLGSADAGVFDRIATIVRDGRMILIVDPTTLLDQAQRDIVAKLAGGAGIAIGA